MNQPPRTGLPLTTLPFVEGRSISYAQFPGIQPGPSGNPRVRSRSRAVACFALSIILCAASLTWILIGAPNYNLSFNGRPAPALVQDVTPRLVTGGIGILGSAGLGVMALMYWPRSRRKQARPKDLSLSTYDSVTGLPSRRLYLVLLSQAIARARTTGKTVVVLVAGLEQFRPLPTSATVPNMTLVVRVQAARIKSALQSHDSVARLDDRTFAVMVDNLDAPDQAVPIAEKIRHTMSHPLFVEGQELLLSCRIGCAIAPQDGTEAASLLDGAMQVLSHSQNDDASIRFLSNPVTHAGETQRSDALSAHHPRSSSIADR